MSSQEKVVDALQFSDLICTLHERPSDTALFENGNFFSNKELLDQINHYKKRVDCAGVKQGDVVAFFGDFSFQTVSLFAALAHLGIIVVPLSINHKKDLKV